MTERVLILAIESAIAGGSLAVLSNGDDIGNWTGEPDKPLRAEILLNEIRKLLQRTSVRKEELTRLAVSVGPGSFTGIRVGAATGMGLARGLGIPMSSLSVLEALAFSRSHTGAVAVPVGRGAAAYQMFEGGRAASEPASVEQTSLATAVYGSPILAYSGMGSLLPDSADVEGNLAGIVGRFALSFPERSTDPIFLSK